MRYEIKGFDSINSVYPSALTLAWFCGDSIGWFGYSEEEKAWRKTTFADMHAWCYENVPDRGFYSDDLTTSINRFYFREAKHAMLFKLRWA